MTIDLHVHSSASDGTLRPREVVEAAAAAGLRVVGLTDHDTTAGWDEATTAGEHLHVRVVPGAELSCRAGGVSVHMLAYLHDPEDLDLSGQCTGLRRERLDRARRMVHLLAADLPIRWEDVEEIAGPGATIGRPHLADALVALGLASSRSAAFATVLHPTSPYYVRYWAPDAVTTVRRIRAAGGVAVLAHPRARLRGGRLVTDETIAALAAQGLQGLEVDHREHDDADRRHLRALAADLGLLATGSSDFHGAGKPNLIGENTTRPEVLEALEALGKAARDQRP